MTEFKECNRCLLTTNDDPDIQFDTLGICSHCRGYEAKISLLPKTIEERERFNQKKIDEIKQHGKGKKYDCIIGLSGGVDSSFLCYKAKEFGLRPLIVHFDNGWNSELAVNNIESIVNSLAFDLYTYVVDWEEFKDLQRAYIKSGVLDWEIPTDHGFYAMLYDQAYKHKIKYILSGHNIVTEGILPKCMRWSKLDVANILDIQKQFGKKKLKTFPLLSFYKLNYYNLVNRLIFYSPLNYIHYNKDQAKEIIKNEMDWRDYGGKHYESIFTRFYQGYVLIEKFGFDKRRAHLSTLINSGQITKEQAKKEIKKPPYDSNMFTQDKEFVLKKLNFSVEEFESIMKEKPKSHLDYKSYETGLYRQHENFMKTIKPFTRLLKKIFNS